MRVLPFSFFFICLLAVAGLAPTSARNGPTDHQLSFPFVALQLPPSTMLISVASDGTPAGGSLNPSISNDGRYVAFSSYASDLVSGDSNDFCFEGRNCSDIFVRDWETGETTRVSVASDGTQGNGDSQGPSLSGDGRLVAFTSYASNLVSGDSNGGDIFVHDRQTGETTRVSVASDGTEANGESTDATFSADGRYVAFSSLASNLVAGDSNNEYDVFVHDRQTGETTLVSVASDGTQGNGLSYARSLSADGRYVAFSSLASNLVDGDDNNEFDVFVHDRQTGETTLVSVASDGTKGNGLSGAASLSADGRYVAFHSEASNLVSDDTRECLALWSLYNCWDVFVHDRQTGETTRVSVASDGTQGDGNSLAPSISADGRYVAFDSLAGSLIEDDTSYCPGVGGEVNICADLFVHDRQTHETERVSVTTDGRQGHGTSEEAAISADGRFVAFHSSSRLESDGMKVDDLNIYVRDRGQ